MVRRVLSTVAEFGDHLSSVLSASAAEEQEIYLRFSVRSSCPRTSSRRKRSWKKKENMATADIGFGAAASPSPSVASERVWRIPQGRYVDAVRWLPPATAWDHLLAVALWNSETGRTQLEISTLLQESPAHPPSLDLRASWPQSARISVLEVSPISSHHAILATASYAGSLSFFVTDLLQPSPALQPLICPSLHEGPVSDIDLQSDTRDCVSVGEDGKINLVKLSESQLQKKCIFDNQGLMSFSAACWASPVEFVTAGLGFALHWWDHRKPGGPVSQSPTKWTHAEGVGTIHSIDVHPSRKHLCVVGGSNGVVLAWDLRWQKEPLHLSGPSYVKGQVSRGAIVESDVWEVKYDPFMLMGSSGIVSNKIPPVMMCSEDGILAVLEPGEATSELLAEPCAINTFDIDSENGSDVVCGLEYESLLYFKRLP